MTARWVVEHAQDQVGTGGWVEYSDEDTARIAAGTAGTVWALVPPALIAERDRRQDVVGAAQAWRRWTKVPLTTPYEDDQVERALADAVDALSAAEQPGVASGTSEASSALHGDAGPADGTDTCGPCRSGDHESCDWDEQTPPDRCPCPCESRVERHGPSSLAGYTSPRCAAGMDGCDDLACVCACHHNATGGTP